MKEKELEKFFEGFEELEEISQKCNKFMAESSDGNPRGAFGFIMEKDRVVLIAGGIPQYVRGAIVNMCADNLNLAEEVMSIAQEIYSLLESRVAEAEKEKEEPPVIKIPINVKGNKKHMS